MNKIRILIADDHDIVLRGLHPLLESEAGWEVCGEARDGQQAVEMCRQLKPDVIVLDIGMPLLDGVEATRQIRQQCPETEVLAFTGQDSETLVHSLFAAGALAFVLKSEAGDQLIPAIKALAQHQPYLAPRTTRVVFERYLQGSTPVEREATGGLTPREVEMVRLLASGKSNKDVAAALGISVKTVEAHRSTIMRKLDFTAFSDLVRYAVRSNLVEP